MLLHINFISLWFQFDAEAKALQTQEQQDAVIAQRIASESHQLSDSEEEDNDICEVTKSEENHATGRKALGTKVTSEHSHSSRSKVMSEDSPRTERGGREMQRSSSDKKIKTASSG